MIHIKIKVYPDQPKEKIIKNDDDSYDLYIREPAKDGMANRRVLSLMTREIKPRPKRVKIVSGHTSPTKIIEVEC